MRIPGGGDLAPPRRRRYGGSYGRRRRQRTLRLAAAVLLLGVIGTGGAYLLRQDDTKAPERLTTQQPSSCPTPAPTTTTTAPTRPPAKIVLPAAGTVHLVVLNGTARNGLAKTVADQLAAQGFVVTGQGNAPAALAGASTVTFGSGAQPAGTLVSRWIAGSRLVGNPKQPAGSVQVVLGSDYKRLSTPAEVAAAGTATQPVVAPRPTPTGCAA